MEIEIICYSKLIAINQLKNNKNVIKRVTRLWLVYNPIINTKNYRNYNYFNKFLNYLYCTCLTHTIFFMVWWTPWNHLIYSNWDLLNWSDFCQNSHNTCMNVHTRLSTMHTSHLSSNISKHIQTIYKEQKASIVTKIYVVEIIIL